MGMQVGSKSLCVGGAPVLDVYGSHIFVVYEFDVLEVVVVMCVHGGELVSVCPHPRMLLLQ
jgi:hypothetical protein